MAIKPTQSRVWQRMLSGRRLDLIDPSPLDIEIDDIAHGLARVARWNGQTRGKHAFSVAQHSVLVLTAFDLINPKASTAHRMSALLHDGPEYVVGDMISPFKAVIGEDYKLVEKRIMQAIHLRFGLPPVNAATLETKIKRADRVSAFFEATELAGFEDSEAAKFFGRPRGLTKDLFELEPLSAQRAQAFFLQAFHSIEKTRDGKA